MEMFRPERGELFFCHRLDAAHSQQKQKGGEKKRWSVVIETFALFFSCSVRRCTNSNNIVGCACFTNSKGTACVVRYAISLLLQLPYRAAAAAASAST